MKVDSLGSVGVTSDPQNVRPGMIYVDLSGRRNRRQIYEAHKNGASLIFTPYNISDPELPVIKIKNPRDTLYMLIDRFLGNQERSAKLIGIFGESDKSVIIEMIQNILNRKEHSTNINALGMNMTSSVKNRNIDDFFTSFMDLYNTGADIIPMTIDTNNSSLFYFGNMNLDCAIVADMGPTEREYKDRALKTYLTGLSEKNAIIMNNDNMRATRVVEELKGIRAITYGLNKKAAVTASSIDVDEITCFNYCVQRSFLTRKGERIEPFEIPIRLNALGSHNLYNALAAITCGLYYGKDIDDIKATIESCKTPARHFQKIYDGDFTVIDNYCSSLNDYAAAFDSMQILNYGNLILIVSVSQDANLNYHLDKAMLLNEWARILKCKEVILTSCMDGGRHIGELPLKSMRIYKKIFRESGMNFRYYHLLQHAIERGMSELRKSDLMVMLGSDEMNIAHKMFHRRFRQISSIIH